MLSDYGDESPPTPPPSRCSGCLRFLRQLLSFLLSHIGLLSLVVGYCIMGAFIFEELERENELSVKRNVTATRHAITDKLWDITREMEVLVQDNWTDQVTGELRSFEKSLIIALKEKGWDGKESEDTLTWTFAGGLFYSITVITTIGYGHIAPKTAVAKIVTIFYAILGIPLTVLCWSNIGDAMANAFRFFYWRIFCYVCTKKPKKRRRRNNNSRSRTVSVRHRSRSRGRSIRRSQRTSQRSADSAISDSMNSYSISDPERFYDEATEKEFLERGIQRNRPSQQSKHSVEYESNGAKSEQSDPALLESTEKGSQDDSLEGPPGKKQSAASRMARGFGFKRESQKSNRSGSAGDSPGPTTPTQPNFAAAAAAARVGRPMYQTPMRLGRVPEDEWVEDPYYFEDYEYEEYEDEMDDYSTKSVPIWLSICLVIGYILGGAFLFQNWEGWSLLDSSYFCFITLTTIGFGDLTPDQKDQDGEQRIALCSLYLLFGIAMICMSFNLVQEEVINSVKNLAKQCGILKDDDEEEDY